MLPATLVLLMISNTIVVIITMVGQNGEGHLPQVALSRGGILGPSFSSDLCSCTVQ